MNTKFNTYLPYADYNTINQQVLKGNSTDSDTRPPFAMTLVDKQGLKRSFTGTNLVALVLELEAATSGIIYLINHDIQVAAKLFVKE